MIARLFARMLSEHNRLRFLLNMLVECAWAQEGKGIVFSLVINDLDSKTIEIKEVETGVYMAQLGEPKE